MKIAFIVHKMADMRGGNRLLFNIAKTMNRSFNIQAHVYSIETVESVKAADSLTVSSFGVSGRLHFIPMSEEFFNDYPSRISSYITQTSTDIVNYIVKTPLTKMFALSTFLSLLTSRGSWKQSANTQEVAAFIEALTNEYDVVQIGDWNNPITRMASLFQSRSGCTMALYPFYHHFDPLNRVLRIPALKRIMIKGALSKFDRVTVSTPYELDFFSNMGLSHVYFVGEGVDLENIKKILTESLSITDQVDKKHILFIGVRAYAKGYSHFLIAMDKVAQLIGYDKLRVTIVGKKQEVGPFPSPELYYASNHAYGRLKKAGIITDYTSVSEGLKLSLIASCSLIVLPSMLETIPLVALEGWALKKPCILAISTSVSSIVRRDGDGAFLVQFGDVNGLVRKTLALLDNTSILDEAGNAGYRKVLETYNLASVSKKLIDAYGCAM